MIFFKILNYLDDFNEYDDEELSGFEEDEENDEDYDSEEEMEYNEEY